MENRKPALLPDGSEGVTRRRFLQGVAAGGALLGLGGIEKPVWALAQQAPLQELSGTTFELTIGETPVNYTGKIGVATTVNEQLPAPLLRWREGDTVTLKVTNRLKVPTSIHWHGILLPNAMDGVPGMTFAGIAPGESFTYQFAVRQSGTYWYHSHSGFQEQTGLYGPLVIEPRHHPSYHFDREYVVMLSDWTDASPEHVYSRLKKMDGYYNYAQPTLRDFIQQA
ncbi:MAG TPA: multicopper oxidase domain-containing protein, partial [Gammaproteobacteria bacterium]